MTQYDGYSREELIRRIEELEAPGSARSKPEHPQRAGWFRERYSEAILDSIPDMLTVFAKDGTMVELVSAEQTNHSGLMAEQLSGIHVRDILTPEHARNFMNNLNQVFTSGHWSKSYHDITLNGHTNNYENRIFPLDAAYALCMCRDITAEQLAKQELETVKYAMYNVDQEICACDVQGNIIYANERFRLRNKLEGDLAGRKLYEFWVPVGNENLWQERLMRIRETEGAYKYTVRFKNEKGEIVARDVLAYIMQDQFRDKEIVWFFGHDVTQRILQENRLKEMNSVMNSILNNVPVYLFVKDPGNEFRYLYWNRAFEIYSGITAERALGHTDFEIFPNVTDAEKFHVDDLALLQSGERLEKEEEYLAVSGEVRYLTTSKALVSMENRLPLIIGVSWDITDRKMAEAEVIASRNKAEESDRLKSAFLANMSHEIRTPLNAIVGFSKLIFEIDDDMEKQQYADIIDMNAELLLQLINDILDISKIEAGTLEFYNREMDLNDLCRNEYEVMRGRLDEGVELIFDQKYDNVKLYCDQNRLTQVVTNLLTNACKFTSTGEICFGFDVRGDKIDFYVKDTGMGIAADKVGHIFDRFVKLNNFAVGTGLGLAISKMIIERMGGTICVESELERGSCFHFTIPMRQLK